MDQANTSIKQRSCFKCGYFGETVETTCPQCNRGLQTSSSIRLRGVLMVLCGTFLIGMMGYISLWALTAVDSTSPVGARFTGTQQEKMLIFALFAVLIIFGLVSFAGGIWQIIAGRRSKAVVWIGLALGLLVAIGGGAVIALFK
ncbi:MAG: hypothetical protein ABIV21_09575 [Pyrinomonadaceae bacterium]